MLQQQQLFRLLSTFLYILSLYVHVYIVKEVRAEMCCLRLIIIASH